LENHLGRISVNKEGMEHVWIILCDVAPVALPFLKKRLKHGVRLKKLPREIFFQGRRPALSEIGPNDAEALLGRICLDPHLAGNAGVRAFHECRQALAPLIEGPAVVAATQSSGEKDSPAGKHHSPVRATIY
jgi:hypothetical protein